jgi:hypothetical protein
MSTSLSLEQRFVAKIDRSGDGGCWLWTATLINSGYGRFWLAGKTELAHRVAYELWVGPIPVGVEVDHLCHNPDTCNGGVTCPHRRCVNPDHLILVPHRLNLLRGNTIPAHNAVKTHCSNGHRFSAENTRMQFDRKRRSFYRVCRQCDRERPRHHAVVIRTR